MTFQRLHTLLLLGAAATWCGEAQTYNISRLGPLGAVTGVNADNISFAPPVRVALDSTGKFFGELFGTTYVTTDSQVFAIGGVPHTVTAIVGSAYQGFAGDGGPASNALLNAPYGVAVAANGDLYISDSGNNRVRKVHNGFITTYAGGNGSTPSGFYSANVGDGGPATQANVTTPAGLCLDAAGNLYVADSGNNRVRRIDGATGIITTVAGGVNGGGVTDGLPATQSALFTPYGVALDASGDLFIAQYLGEVVTMVSAADQKMRVVAGTMLQSGNNQPIVVNTNSPKTTLLAQPTDLAIDNATGRVWIATRRGIYVLSNFLHNISRAPDQFIPGIGTPQVITGLAVDGGGNVLVASANANRTYRFTPDAGNPGATITGSYAADLGNGFQGLTPDGLSPVQSQGRLCDVTYGTDGSLYYGDTDLQIRKITPGYGTVTTIAGTGQSGDTGDNGLAVNATFSSTCHIKADGHGHLFVGGINNGPIRKIDLTTGIVTTVLAVASTQQLAVDTAGNLYYTDTANYVKRIDAITGNATIVAGNGTAADTGDGGPALSAGLESSKGLAVDAKGNLYIGTATRIRKVDPSTQIITTFAGGGASKADRVPGTQATIAPGYLAVDARGNVIFPDTGSNLYYYFPYGSYTLNSEKIRRVNPAGTIDTLAGIGDFGNSGDGSAATQAGIAVSDSVAVAPSGDIAILQTVVPTIDFSGGSVDNHYARILSPQAMPYLTASFQSKTDGTAPNNRVWTLNVTNSGPGASLNPRVINFTDSVNGPGPVYVSGQVPTPLGSSIQPGASSPFSLSLYFPVTTPVTRISLTVTMSDDSGQIYTTTFNNLFR